MQEIKDLKTRDFDILCKTLRDMSGIKRGESPWRISVLMDLVKSLAVDTYIIYSKDLDKWVFTDILDDDLIYQDFFSNMNFVIVESDLCLALARGIHYRYHKKARP